MKQTEHIITYNQYLEYLDLMEKDRKGLLRGIGFGLLLSTPFYALIGTIIYFTI